MFFEKLIVNNKTMESRIQILNRLARKFGKRDNIISFEEFVKFYDAKAVTMLVYQAMIVHSREDKKLAVCRVKTNFCRQLLIDMNKIESGEMHHYELFDKTFKELQELEKEEEEIEGTGNIIIKEA